MGSFWIGAILIAATSLGESLFAARAQAIARAGFPSSNTVSPFPMTVVEPYS